MRRSWILKVARCEARVLIGRRLLSGWNRARLRAIQCVELLGVR